MPIVEQGGRVLARRTLDGPRRRRFGKDGSARRLACLGALLVPSLYALAPASAEETAAPASTAGLTIAVLDLADIPELAPRVPPEVRRPTWRTTFGSERETQPEIKVTAIAAGPLAGLAEADVVLIQGVQAAAPLRRLFPPRVWRLVVSRRILSPDDPVGFRSVRSGLPPTTAIAVKARPDLRVTARTFALRLEEQPPATADQPQGAATAVRLVDRGRTLWLASVSLPASCSAEDPPCPALQGLDIWREEKLKIGEPTFIGGRMNTRPAPQAKAEASPADCVSHTIDTDLKWERMSPATGANSPETGTGCISIVRLAY